MICTNMDLMKLRASLKTIESTHDVRAEGQRVMEKDSNSFVYLGYAEQTKCNFWFGRSMWMFLGIVGFALLSNMLCQH